MTLILQPYQQGLQLDNHTIFTRIKHNDAIMADVYWIKSPNKPYMILKICDRPHHYHHEVYGLNYFQTLIPVPAIIRTLAPSSTNHGAILMEYVPGHLCQPSMITAPIAFQLGSFLATIHNQTTAGFGYLHPPSKLASKPTSHFREKFLESMGECKNHLSADFLSRCAHYLEDNVTLITQADGPCLIHRDFRPANILIHHHRLSGIIDWSSTRAGFAEDDFCSIEHGEWGDFNHHKKDFLQGYASRRSLPNYQPLMPLLRLSRALAVIGFTLKRQSWQTSDAKLYQANKQFVDHFFQEMIYPPLVDY